MVAEAIWQKTREHDFITVLDHTHIAPIPASASSALASYQNSILSSGNGDVDVPSKFVRTKKEKRKGDKSGSSSVTFAAEASTTILDNNTSQAAVEQESMSSAHAFSASSALGSSSSSSSGIGNRGAKGYESDDDPI